MVKLCGVVLLALVSGGCLSRPALHKETFAFSAPAASRTNEAVGGCVLEVKSLQVASPFDSRSLIYRTGDFAYERDPYAEFLGPPSEILVVPVSEMLLANGCCRAVVEAKEGVKPDRLVQMNITQLYGDIRRPGHPSAVLAMQITVMDTTNGLAGSVVFSRSYSRNIPMKSTAPAALMEGWNQALAEIFAEIAPQIARRENQSEIPK